MKSQSVLIVEDESIVALDLKTQLQKLQYDVVGIAQRELAGASKSEFLSRASHEARTLAAPSSPACGPQATTQGNE